MTSFDPYHVWLGIPPAEQPPNHYRLLALALFENAPDVIENAADRQMAHVRRAATGKHGEASQRLLGEIASARRCLLDGSRKAEYDARLRSKDEAVPVGVDATMEWKPSKPPKPPASRPPRREQPAEPPQRWKAAPHSEPPPETPVEAPALETAGAAEKLSVKASPSLSRVRRRRKGPVILLAVVVGLAALPIVLLLVVLAAMSNQSSVAAGDDEQGSAQTAVPSTSTSTTREQDDDAPPLPSVDVNNDSGSRADTARPLPSPARDDDDRDPFDNTASFGRTSGEAVAETSFDLSAKTTMIELAKLHLPAHAATNVTVKAGQIVRLKIAGQCRIGFQAYDIRGGDGVWVAVGSAGAPAAQFFRGSSDLEFAVTKDGRLFLALDDLIPADNQGSLAVEVAVYE